MVEVQGKGGIVAKIMCDSVSQAGNRLTTFELSYPRIVHAEFMTHRMFSRNAASSRAIPFTKMVEQLGAMPVRFGQANSGMQDKGVEHNVPVYLYDEDYSYIDAWKIAQHNAEEVASAFNKAGFHKQVMNRLLEPFQFIKVVVTATEWANFFWLRDDGPADPTIAELARCMRAAYDSSVPLELLEGEYHLPYVNRSRSSRFDNLIYSIEDGDSEIELTVEDAIIVSGARCAAVSFRKTDYDLEKSKQVYDRLVGDDHKHGSALEHQAKVMMKIDHGDGFFDPENVPTNPNTWEDGVSHVDRDHNLWSGNFVGWIQNRKLIPGENHAG